MRALVVLLVSVLGLCVVLQTVAVGGAWWLGSQNRRDDEIAWLEGLRPLLVWDTALDGQINRLYRARIRRDLDASQIDRAVVSLRRARARIGHTAEKMDAELMGLGIETFTRAADKMEARGLLTMAAAWDESLFVLAIRAPLPYHRYAALAAFQEALDLRLRNGEPCQALERVEWAKRGLGGQIPGFQPSIEEDLRLQCAQTGNARR